MDRRSHSVLCLRWTGLLLTGLLILIGGCRTLGGAEEARPTLVDPDATDETRALYTNLQAVVQDHILFGHQDDLAYGVHWDRRSDSLAREAGDRQSDVRGVTGAYPAVYGWDVGDIGGKPDQPVNIDSIPYDRMRDWMVEGYERGGVITVSWHMNNPVSGRHSWDTTRAVSTLLPDSSHHDTYRRYLDRFAEFAKSLEAGFWTWIGGGHPVPIIFRPFHEMTGSWFWWGGDNTSPEAYKRLWRFTVEYLRDEKDVHNLLYAYSPDIFESKENYLRYYPGDAYVDVLGYDDYHTLPATFADTIRVDTLAVDTLSLAAADTVAAPAPDAGRTVRTDTVTVSAPDSVRATPDSARATLADTSAAPPDSVAEERVVRRVTVDSVRIPEDTIEARAARALADRFRTVVQLAEERGKVAAFTETGDEGIPDSTWWTDRLLPVLKADSTTRKLAYVLVWRNENERKKPGHYYAPYPGHPSADDFVRFYEDPFTLFEDGLPDLYD
jgi:hypothetical protein